MNQPNESKEGAASFPVKGRNVALLGLALPLIWSLWAFLVWKMPAINMTAPKLLSRAVCWGIPCAYYLVRARPTERLRPLGLRFPGGASQVARAVIVPLIAAALLFWGTTVQKQQGASLLFAKLLAHAGPNLLAPISEEIAFRGVLFSEALTWAQQSENPIRLRLRFWFAVSASAVSFVMVHWPYWLLSYGWEGAVVRSGPLLVTGLVLTYLFAHTRSLYGCIFVHWLNNELSVL